jgi:hypothetical protein
VPEPLVAFDAVTLTVLEPKADDDGVAFSVTVVDAPDASVTDVGDTDVVHPAGPLRVTENVADVQPLSLLVIVAVYERCVPGEPDCVVGASDTDGAARVHTLCTTYVPVPVPVPL